MRNEQTVTKWNDGKVEELRLPAPAAEIFAGVLWGRHEDFFTPAFWISRIWIDGDSSVFADYKIGRSLREEVAACLLGGFGMPAEVGLKAFDRLRDSSMLDGAATAAEIEGALREPLIVGGRSVRYRYPRQKSGFLATAMNRMAREAAPVGCARDLRDWFLTFDGIGPKTASWITRNHLDADEVAILDVHVLRAGVLMGLFPAKHSLPRDYFSLEARLVAFAKAIDVRLSKFDSIVWCYMRQLNQFALTAMGGSAVNNAT